MATVSELRPGTPADAIDGVVPRHVVEPETPELFARTLAHATRERLQTVIRGGGTKLDWGRLPARVDLVVSTARLNRLIAHRHGDLTVTAQPGLRLRDLNAALRDKGQWLPVDSAFENATVGGIVATNDAGPSRHRNGTPRDLVIGMTLALTDGRVVKSGGTVVKNVAGYDLGKLVSGSHGALAGIADVTFKLVPIPQTSSTLTVTYSESQADALARDVAAIAASQIEPAALDVRAERGDKDTRSGVAGDRLPYTLRLRIATSPAATDAQIAAARAMVSGEAVIETGDREAGAWSSHIADPWRGDAVVRVSWLPARLPQVLALVSALRDSDGAAAVLVGRALGTGLIRLAGPLPVIAAAVDRLRASGDVGHVVVVKAPRALKEQVDVWGPPRDSDRVLQSLKRMFDPAGILNANRGPI